MRLIAHGKCGMNHLGVPICKIDGSRDGVRPIGDRRGSKRIGSAYCPAGEIVRSAAFDPARGAGHPGIVEEEADPSDIGGIRAGEDIDASGDCQTFKGSGVHTT